MKHRAAGRWETAVALLRCMSGEFGIEVQTYVVGRLALAWLRTYDETKPLPHGSGEGLRW